MSEYSGAPGRQVRNSIGRRAMEVDRQPSVWPCIAMLAGLLVLCLAAPQYWQNKSVLEDATIGPMAERNSPDSKADASMAATPRATATGLSSWPFQFDGFSFGRIADADPDPQRSSVVPSLDELISTRIAMSAVTEGSHGQGDDGYQWRLLTRSAGSRSSGTNDGVWRYSPVGTELIPTSPLTEGAAWIGQQIADLSAEGSFARLWGEVSNRALRLVEDCENEYQALLISSAGVKTIAPELISGRGPVRVSGPDDRLAMAQPPRELQEQRAWCVPQVLFEQLDRLSGQPESAQWSSHVRNQLHSLTERAQLEGDDVQSILADLSESAQEALQIADRTDNDGLRVEMLRAHWALARRLDCWGALHEKRVAERSNGRLAAREAANPYLRGALDQLPEGAETTGISNELEKYEATRDPRLGRFVALQAQALKTSPSTVDRSLGDAIEQHYRNANVRVAITAEMLNRLAGQKHEETAPVHEQLAGTFVHGKSNIRSDSQVLLDPSNDEWQIKLSAKGTVESTTFANSGPVHFRSRGNAEFSGEKTIVVNDTGVHLLRSGVSATSHNRLLGVTTDYDWVPILGDMARDRALQEYWSRRGRVKSRMESQVELQAREKLDEQTRDAVAQIQQQTYDRFASQLDQFGLKLTPIEMRTTTDRLVARVRVAGDKQLGSHTPRPRALSDSLASAQIHETAFTNLAVTLGLDGKRYTAPELQKMLREKFPQAAAKKPMATHADTVFQFAQDDAVRVRINDGRLELTIAFASIEYDGETMPDVQVHAYYVPKVDGLNAEMVRDGTLGIEGHLGSTERAQLHNMFNRVLPPERHLPLVHVDNPHDQRFEGLMITQLVLEDGWMGLAVGPTTESRTAERTRSLR